MGKLKQIGAGLGLLLLSAAASIAQTTPVDEVEGIAATATPVWTGIAGLSATAFVFAMIIAFARKGKK